MKKNKLLLVIIIMSTLANAQNNPDIVGLYNLGSQSPEGGSHLFVLENGNYAITYFGGIQTGKWEVTEENICKFSPNIKASTFELFGRHNKDLKGNTKFFFSGFENGETFIQLRTEKEEKIIMQRVFNEDANCFSLPYVYTFKTIPNSILFMSLQYGDNNTKHPVITIENPNGYNDFVANFIEVNDYEAQPLIAKFKDDTLFFEENHSIERIPLDEFDEDVEFIKKIIDMESNRDTIYLNPSYNTFGDLENEENQRDIHEFHVFNEQKNAFIDPEYYVEGREYSDSEEFYEDMSIVYSYSALTEFDKKLVKCTINEKPLFQVNCD